MRTILTFGFIFLYLLVGYIPLGIFWLYGKLINQDKADFIQLRMVQWVFKIIHVLAGIKITVIGEENVPTDEAVLYVANHRSMADIVVTYARCPRLTGFVAKKGVDKVPALRAWMRRLHCEFLDRDDIKQGLKVILSCIEKVKNGISIFIFPEGTRNKNSADPTDIGEFKDGSFKIASKTGCKVVPVAITGTNKVFEDHFPYIKSANVILEYGKPITIKELDKEDQKHVGLYFQNVVQQMLIGHQNM
ncbi:MAG: 1-acyl-sn-glycerol-3-phosphate acyltransferase [Agathobacter sp.]|nr:1-acyl-sn-glycerol-3-phosphate acyltransferase [Agathobacter sp.]